MTGKQEKIIGEFIEATPTWVKAVERMEKVGGIRMCLHCGIQPSKMLELCDAIKALRDEKIIAKI
jgi:hypothetical protein